MSLRRTPLALAALGASLLALLLTAALAGAGRRPRRARHHSDDGGHTSRIGVLGHANGAAIHPPCVLAPLGPASAIAAPVPAESPPTAVTAKAKVKGLRGDSTGVFLPVSLGGLT